MAAIGKIRKHYALVVIVIGVALLAFVLGDFGGSRAGKISSLGEVNGKKINYIDYERKVGEIVDINSMNTDPSQMAEMQMRVRQSVWGQMVEDAVMNDEYNKLGIFVSTEELNYLVRGPEPHQFILANFSDPQTGELDRVFLDNFLAHLNNPELVDPRSKNVYLYIEDLIKQETINKKYSNLITNGYYYPRAFAEKSFKDKVNQYNVSYVAENYKSIADSLVSATTAELKKYYNDHKEDFKTEETREIIYIDQNINPSAKDRQNLKDHMNKSFEEFKKTTNISAFIASESEVPYNPMWLSEKDLIPQVADQIMNTEPGNFIAPFEYNKKMTYYKVEDKANRPDSLKATHILISYAQVNPAVTLTKEQAKAKADSILNVVKRDTSVMTKLAVELSDDPSAQANNGNLGWFLDGMMVPEFNEFLVDNKLGSVGVVETSYGYHVVKVDGKTSPKAKIKLAEVTREFVPSEETYKEYYVKMSSFAAKTESASELEENAREEGYNVKSNVVEKMSQKLGAINNSREVIKWSFSEDAAKKPVSKIYEFDGKLVLAAVKNSQEEGYLPFEKVEQRIKPLVLRDKKAEILKDRMQKAKSSNSTIEAIASSLGVEVETAIVHGNTSSLNRYGQEPYVVGVMLGAEENKLSDVVVGDQAVYIFTKTLGSTLEDKTDFTADQDRISNQIGSRINTRAIKNLVDNAKIKDNRIKFY
ncbi:MAG: SurA N-terminal domain-containing protein [Bacteroidales bacterium]|jgi:peptidyl-prolyl cis-trans isomerase D